MTSFRAPVERLAFVSWLRRCAAGTVVVSALFLAGCARVDVSREYTIGYGNDLPLHFRTSGRTPHRDSRSTWCGRRRNAGASGSGG
jgi:hypothetical protein